MLFVREFLHRFLSRLVIISSCLLVNNLMLLMWENYFVDLYHIVVHAFKHVLGERDYFMLDHVIELYPLLNNIQMITWLKLWCIDSSSWFSFDHPRFIWPWCGPSCFILAFLHVIPFLKSHEWDSQWDICLGSWMFFWKFHHRILKTLTLQIFPFFWWYRSSKNLIMISFLLSCMRSSTRYASSTWICWAISSMLLYYRIYFYLCIFVLLTNFYIYMSV